MICSLLGTGFWKRTQTLTGHQWLFAFRGETLNNKFSRQFSSFKDLPVEERFLLKNAVECGSKHEEINLCSAEGQQIMAEARREGSAEGFIELIMDFTAGLDAGAWHVFRLRV
ncbi:uncharacterized protein LOC131303710 isoform X3 [Rhododendron vialii]|uniref:uncharacterized protein LOC131303710 isoform X3 n=1 Tax=Rhododendron vialii TaxID=182163 RepID=UPI00265F3E9D|nr:uncharacterized protein LOC131303710 isoform X3 [Rhododendron vialii]